MTTAKIDFFGGVATRANNYFVNRPERTALGLFAFIVGIML
jgi:hypothetical protein